MLFALLPLVLSGLQQQTIPAGIKYKAASSEVNAQAKKRLEAFFHASPETADYTKLTGSAVTIGPGMWAAMKKAVGSDFKGTRVTFVVPSADKVQKFEGRVAKTPDSIDMLWIGVSIIAHKSKTQVVRRAKADELSYYWALISYDLEEPLFVVECGKVRFIVDFLASKDGQRAFFIDIVGGVSKD